MRFFAKSSSQLRRGNMFFTILCGFIFSSSWFPGTTAKSAADYYVRSLPGAPQGPLLKMHAGHIEVDSQHNGNLFFWHFQNKHIANKQRTVIWLNGGPGCSSLDGALMEVGPYRVRKGGKLEYNEGSWNEFANLLFVDNPVGVGFSYVNTDSYLHELNEMADQFIIFMEKFFELFPEFSKDDLYIAGESYAGQYIPYIGQAILDRNKKDGKALWALKGLMIGNGWISPKDQYPAYTQFAYSRGLIKQGDEASKAAEKQLAICNSLLEGSSKDSVSIPSCEEIMRAITTLTQDHNADLYQQCVNMYDVRLKDDLSCGMNWPPDLTHIQPYLQRPDVIQALNINPDKKTGWQECVGAVTSRFTARKSRPSVTLMPGILTEVPIVLFSGDQDLICNHVGTENLINNLEWNGGKGFELSPGITAPRRDWTFEGKHAGFYQEARNLTYVLFKDASHMVPFDYARRTRDMLDRFMGVDIASIGGKPTDSRIDGEKQPATSVGGHPNSTVAEQAEKTRLKDATWKAYYKSAEVALILIVLAAGIWGWFVWRERRRRAGYRGVFGTDQGQESLLSGMGLDSYRGRSRSGRDVEAADFDETALEDLGGKSHQQKSKEERPLYDEPPNSRYSLGEASASSTESDKNEKRRNAKNQAV